MGPWQHRTSFDAAGAECRACVGDVLRALWRRGVTDVEVLRPEFDAHGYDIVLT